MPRLGRREAVVGGVGGKGEGISICPAAQFPDPIPSGIPARDLICPA